MGREKAKEVINVMAKGESKDEKLIREDMKEAITTGDMNGEI